MIVDIIIMIMLAMVDVPADLYADVTNIPERFAKLIVEEINEPEPDESEATETGPDESSVDLDEEEEGDQDRERVEAESHQVDRAELPDHGDEGASEGKHRQEK